MRTNVYGLRVVAVEKRMKKYISYVELKQKNPQLDFSELIKRKTATEILKNKIKIRLQLKKNNGKSLVLAG